MDKPDYGKVRNLYGWIAPDQQEDAWHARTSRVIKSELGIALDPESRLLMNLGCGGFHYNLPTSRTVCVDVTPTGHPQCEAAVEADAERLPFRDGCFDAVVCVGSVLNYTDAPRCIAELSRVLSGGGLFILEFERSESATYWRTQGHRQWVWPVRTQYKGHPHRFWVYSERGIRELLGRSGIEIQRSRHFHILGAWVSRLLGLSAVSSLFSFLDPVFEGFRMFSGHSANVLLVCKKVVTSEDRGIPSAASVPRRNR